MAEDKTLGAVHFYYERFARFSLVSPTMRPKQTTFSARMARGARSKVSETEEQITPALQMTASASR